MNRVYRIVVLSFFCMGMASSAYAQDAFEQYYGSGVHAYFAGDYERAEEIFNDLVDAGSQDPRVFYFRGLTQIQSHGCMCMIELGMADFEQAAELETSGKRSADVSKALSRIQGPTRIAIERIRLKARFNAKLLQADAIQMSGALPSPDTGAAPQSRQATPNDPFADDKAGSTTLTEGVPTPMPEPSAPAADSSSPFDNPPAPDPSLLPPAPTPPAPDNLNPFGDDPIPAPAPAEPAPSDNPFGT
jgi:hypothetical protein